MMKLKIYALVVALSAAWSLQSCDNNDDESLAVPAELQSAFSSKYPNVTNVKWETKSGYYVADFYDGYEASAWFTQDGKWQMTETDIPYSALPQAVKTAFETGEYTKTLGWHIDDVDKLEREGWETTFVIEVEKQNQEVDLYYSTEGVLIKRIVDVDDDRDDQYLPEQNVQLTEGMRNFIDTEYPGAKLVEVDREDDGLHQGFTEVDIIHFDTELNRNVSKEVVFDRDGNWFSTSWEVHPNELPAAVTSAIQTTYSGYQIDDAEYFIKADATEFYLIELEKNNNPDIKIKIAKDGTIL